MGLIVNNHNNLDDMLGNFAKFKPDNQPDNKRKFLKKNKDQNKNKKDKKNK